MRHQLEGKRYWIRNAVNVQSNGIRPTVLYINRISNTCIESSQLFAVSVSFCDFTFVELLVWADPTSDVVLRVDIIFARESNGGIETRCSAQRSAQTMKPRRMFGQSETPNGTDSSHSVGTLHYRYEIESNCRSVRQPPATWHPTKLLRYTVR